MSGIRTLYIIISLEENKYMSPWNSIPITTLIVSILKRHNRIIIDNDLLKIIERELKRTPSESEINKALMVLEIRGMIHVYQITRSKRKIEMITDETSLLTVDED